MHGDAHKMKSFKTHQVENSKAFKVVILPSALGINKQINYIAQRSMAHCQQILQHHQYRAGKSQLDFATSLILPTHAHDRCAHIHIDIMNSRLTSCGKYNEDKI